VDWLRPRVKGHKVGGFTPCVDLFKEYVLDFEGFVRIETELSKRQMDVGLVTLAGVEVHDHDDAILTVIRPFVEGEDLVIIRGNKLNIRVGLKCRVVPAGTVQPCDEKFDVPGFVPIAGF
jgi:hypothetical protein